VLRDASRSVHEGPSLYRQDQPDEPVKELLNRVQLHLTEPGSYIFTTRILALEPPIEDSPEALFELGELDLPRLSGRQVSLSLRESVAKAHKVAKVLVETGMIDDPTEQGLSSNFCESLSELSGEYRRSGFEVGFEWGFGEQQNPPIETLHFTEEMADELQRFGTRLRRLARIGPAVVEGKVDGLKIEDPGRRHRIHVKGTARRGGDTEACRIWAFVSEDDYDRAFAAHRENRSIQIEGEIRDERGGLRLHSSTGLFRVLS
jgi:hypothetical protein